MKDHSTFLKAASLLLRERNDVHFVLVGNGVNLENRMMSTQIPNVWKDRFHLLGERDDIEYITAALDIASLASHGEAFPNIICEAMACGVPCVATNVGDTAHIIGETGLMVAPRDPVAMAKAWASMLAMSEEDRRALGQSTRRRVFSLFSIDKVTRQYEELYRGLVEDFRQS